MKRIILLAAFFLLCISSFAQKIQFSNPTNTWSFIDSTVGCCIPTPLTYTTSYYDSLSTTYNGYTYQHIYSYVASCYVRQDGDKVYTLGDDSVERLMYDFNIGLHDTMRTIYPLDTFVTWVTLIDSTQLAGIWYKVWHFEGTEGNGYFTDSVRPVKYNVIEGIGCTNGVYYPADPYSLEAFSSQLLCFNNNSGISTGLSSPVTAYGYTYSSSYDNDSSCAEFYAVHTVTLIDASGVRQLANQNNTVTAIPDPMSATGKLVFANNISSGTVVIINQVGQAITTIPFQNKNAILIGDQIKVPGIYYYRVTDNLSGQVFSGKFVY